VVGSPGLYSHATRQPHATSCPARRPRPPPARRNCTHARQLTMPQGPGPLLRAWYEWRMKRFPWRKKWLVGSWLPQTAAQHILAAHCSNTPQASISTATHSGSSRTSCTPCATAASPSTAARRSIAMSTFLVRAFLHRQTLADRWKRHGYNGSGTRATIRPR
jgi:hypothetical protein